MAKIKDVDDMMTEYADKLDGEDLFEKAAKKSPTKPVNKGGRPKGSKNKPFELKYKRELETFQKDCEATKTDRWKATMQESRKFVDNAMDIAMLPRIDLNHPDSVRKRVGEYFQICMDHDLRPSLAGLALSFHISKITLNKYCDSGGDICPESREILNQAKRILNALLEDYMGNSAIDKTLAIFLAKNNFGYKDQQDVVYQNNSQFGNVKSKEEIKNKYMIDMVDAEFRPVDDDENDSEFGKSADSPFEN